MLNERIKTNSFETKEEVSQGFQDLLEPVIPFFKKSDSGHLKLGSHGTVYTESRREVEAFLRPLWGLGPYLTEQESPMLETYLEGIKVGTNPEHAAYWGDVTNFDQLIVEMASLSTFLLLNKEKTWDRLDKKEQTNLHRWLIQANEHTIPKNNWHFFRILVNVAMKKCHMPYSQEIIDQDLAIIDTFYVGKGWYFDGVETQVDYYISFAIHYYSLLYCKFMAEEDPKRVKKMKERAIEFAQSFKYWFDSTGEAIPFGRSLTYRFAQVSFFSALVFAEVEALPWGEIKGLISRHMRAWMNHEIFTTDGLLSVGYHYQNLTFAEGYNAPGSPYWSFKTFILLAVPKDHPYWEAEALPLHIQTNPLSLPESRNFYQYNENRAHLQVFPAGQFLHFQNHASAKYSKFVYSSRFGFSVPKSNYLYYEGAFDSCLALAENDCYFRSKDQDIAYEILEDRVIHQWQPWADVAIKSTIIPLENCHVRIHEINSGRSLNVYEGGFSLPLDETVVPAIDGQRASYETPNGLSSVIGILGFEQADIVRTEPNTNLFYPVTMLPHLKGYVKEGQQVLISIISGRLVDEVLEEPSIVVEEKQIIITQAEKKKAVVLDH
ncbi:DUF2264 domain-containing protein [Candidatus Enterococcus clewellii]|uniref:DUF2264 domain-containing protein n=1 Tax=Candidatus Enterococcus clewellii TaxID=1834193 RepID=A0A242KCS9_9ENTE|nr:DUF2264 domain-containing protein [Enterococcus sp. 9E7_DIV0242]OTP18766.1 hypothetical protein A5888_000580 [Enterococcus sp. 9E7_DIV0242]